MALFLGEGLEPQKNESEESMLHRHLEKGQEVKAVISRSYLLALGLGLLFGTGSNAQFPILDTIADKVIQNQQSSCEQLWDRKGQPKSQKEQEAIQILRNDPDRRAAFINRVAAPIANKMFECGMIP
jgi:hypothetical protein